MPALSKRNVAVWIYAQGAGGLHPVVHGSLIRCHRALDGDCYLLRKLAFNILHLPTQHKGL
jgi:hypothetical protein